jgi:hypothetical protein
VKRCTVLCGILDLEKGEMGGKRGGMESEGWEMRGEVTVHGGLVERGLGRG